MRVHTTRDLKRIATELRVMGDKQLKAEFRKELRKAARPMVPAVKQAIRAIPSKRSYSADGLRGTMSSAVKLQVKTAGKQTGVRLRVDGRKMPAHMKSLPSMVEGKKRWRHPVFGNKEVWVTQDARPYFYQTVNRLGPATRLNVAKAAEHVARKIT
ncbi:MAG TPA: hypothetical protein VN088_21250 [Nocardioides sp.]|nr:hypothetical protein [Nocardioides sp.]